MTLDNLLVVGHCRGPSFDQNTIDVLSGKWIWRNQVHYTIARFSIRRMVIND